MTKTISSEFGGGEGHEESVAMFGLPPKAVTSSIERRPKIDLYATGGGFKLKDKKNTTRNSNFFTSTAHSKRHRYSRSIAPPANVIKDRSSGTRSLFSSYVESELKRKQPIFDMVNSSLPFIGNNF